LVSIAVGALLSHRRLVFHAILVATTFQLCEFIGGLMHAPGLAKGWAETDQTVFWLVLLPVKALALILLGEVGHAAAGILRGPRPGRGVAPR
jgi:hypothetical protein